MRMLLTLLMCGALQAQIPATDARNTEIPNTDTHFTARTYKTLAEWQARRAYLRKQILSRRPVAMHRGPLHPVFGESGINLLDREGVAGDVPGYYLGGNLSPAETRAGRRLPAIVSPHGHWNYRRLGIRCLRRAGALRQFCPAGVCHVLLRHGGLQRHDRRRMILAVRRNTLGHGPLSLQLSFDPRGGLLQSLPDVNASHRRHRSFGRRYADVSADGGG
jgi:hypothetical protein